MYDKINLPLLAFIITIIALITTLHAAIMTITITILFELDSINYLVKIFN